MKQKDLIESIYPLSPMQQGMLFHTLYEPGTGVYVEQVSCTLNGAVDIAVFRRAWQAAVDRHPTLRTAFVWERRDEPFQVVYRRSSLPWEQQDWRGLAPDEQRARLPVFLADDRARGFALTKAPLIRLTLIQIADDAYYFVWTHHHMVLDGWSVSVVLKEVLAGYGAFAQGRPLDLPHLRPYRDYIAWLQRQDLAGAEAFWRRYLGDVTAPTPLGVDRVPDAGVGMEGERYALRQHQLSPEMTAELQAFARRHGLTLNTLAQGAWALLLSRYSGAADVVFGTTVAGRPHDLPGSDAMIGLFINTLPVRAQVPPDATVLPWLQQLQAEQAELRQYEYSPLVQVQGWSAVPRGLPLFESILVFENYPVETVAQDSNGRRGMLIGDVQAVELTNYPLTVEIETRSNLAVSIGYDCRRFDEATIGRMAGHFETLLGAIAVEHALPVSALSILTEAERQALLAAGRPAAPLAPSSACLHQLVEAQATRTPDALALRAGDHSLTYAALDARANQLAHHLQSLGVGPDVVVALLLPRSPDFCLALLAVLKAGGAYLPLDPNYPEERLQFMLADSRAAVLLTTQEQRTKNKEQKGRNGHPQDLARTTKRKGVLHTPPADDGSAHGTTPPTHTPPADDGQPTVVALDAEWETIARQPCTPPPILATPDNLATLCYTSGSTGVPKGAALPHQALVSYTLAMAPHLALGAEDRVLQFAPISFDVLVEELFPAWVAGAAVVLRPEEVPAPGLALSALLAGQGITVVELPTAYWRAWVAELAGAGQPAPAALRLVLMGGERVGALELAGWSSLGCPLLHVYGLTETAVTTTVELVEAGTLAQALPLGRVIGNSDVYVLDAQMELLPWGVVGELYIGGQGLARAYHQRPDLTAERFVPNPFAQERLEIGDWRLGGEAPISNLQSPISTRLYRSGDLVRWRSDGRLEFIGRVDTQVKLRGYRIELGEVEAALMAHSQVQAAVALVREDVEGDARLVAYVVSSQEQRTKPVLSEVEGNKEQRSVLPDQEQRTKNKEQRGEEFDSQFSILNSQFSGELRALLKQRLPEYMVPSAFVLLDALPLTPNGKLDRRALPAPEPDQIAPGAASARFQSPIEDVLAQIFATILNLPEVGREAEFFGLGGHSLLATQLVARVRASCGVDLPLRQVFETPTLADLAAWIDAARRAAQGAQVPPLRAVAGDGPIPLSFAQQRLWFLDQLQPGSPAYNVPTAVRLRGALHVPALRQSLQRLVARHAVLRTTFALHDTQPVQVITPVEARGGDGSVFHDGRAFHETPLPLVDLRALPEAERVAMAQQLVAQELARPFDLARGPLLRATLLRLAHDEHLALLTMHHSISDAWSAEVFVRELTAYYAATLAGLPLALPELPVQYADYAIWQRQWLTGAVLEQQRAYWRNHLADAPMLDLPTDHPRPPHERYRGAAQGLRLRPELHAGLVALSRREGTTLFMTLLAAFKLLLSRYSNQDDIVVGTPIANRGQPETAELIGLFLNTLALRTRLDGQPTVRALLRRVREVCLAAYSHQDLPFEQVVEDVQPTRDLSRHPIFQVVFHLEHEPAAPPSLPGLEMRPLDVAGAIIRFDLALSLVEGPQGMGGVLEYSTDLFEAGTIRRMLGHFEALLEGMVADPDCRVSALPLLTAGEREQLLVEWNATAAAYPHAQCIHQLFEAQAARTPDSIALMFEHQEPRTKNQEPRTDGDATHTTQHAPRTTQHATRNSFLNSQFSYLTYAELNGRANQLAHHLQAMGVGPEVRVGLCMERSPELIVGMLGILKAGGAYVPLDPTYPAERLAFMLEDSTAPLLLTQERLLDELPTSWAFVIALDADQDLLAQQPDTDPAGSVQADNPAYVIYTSGSTGTPKGVQVTHGGLGNMVLAQIGAFGVHPSSRVLQFASLSFDASVSEVFMALLAGATLVLGTPDEIMPGVALDRLMRERRITTITLPPSALAVMPGADLPELKTLIVAGEACPVELMERWAAGRAVFNAYGPTEATVCATIGAWGADGLAPSIGRPISNSQVYLLDGQMEPVPVGVAGELYIGGIGLARGYLNRQISPPSVSFRVRGQ